MDPAPFRRWLPATETEPNLLALAPVYLAHSAQHCWRCGEQVEVVAVGVLRFRDLAAEAEREVETGRAYNFEGEGGWVEMPADTLFLLTHVARLPDLAVEAIREQHWEAREFQRYTPEHRGRGLDWEPYVAQLKRTLVANIKKLARDISPDE